MPLLTNPEVKKLMVDRGFDPSSALRSLGLVTPTADVLRLPGDGTETISYRLGEGLGQVAENRKLMAPVGKAVSTLAHNAPGTALLGALTGAGAGAAFGLGTRRDPLLWGLLGAAGLGAGGYGLSQLIQYMDRRRKQRDMILSKQAFYVENGQDPMQYIQARLFEDSAVPAAQKAQMISQLRTLPENALFSIVDAIKAAGGAAAGYIIGKFLLRLGGFGSTVATGIGALLGSSMGGRPKRNMLGLEADPGTDFFGNRRFV